MYFYFILKSGIKAVNRVYYLDKITPLLVFILTNCFYFILKIFFVYSFLLNFCSIIINGID